MRDLPWDGYPNVRDLGGLVTPLSPTGRTLTGRVARGPRRERLTAAGWTAARTWGVRTVVDLRCADEVGPRDGDPVVPRTAHDGVTMVAAPTEDRADPEFRRTCFPILDSPEYWPHNWRILPDLVRTALEAVADAGPGVLVHCSAGRDRTGMISALLLGHAGVSPDDVADDYAASVRAMAGRPSHAPTADRQQTWTTAQVESWVSRSTPLVAEVAARTEEAFDVVGLATEHRRRLRALLTATTAGDDRSESPRHAGIASVG
ncbi:tyrosine-protein phosphatase [Isoptericola sp. b408]|uniref:tyrosine-protein phosphatase n=1 Tax=Isoptericola sp. b408 TaxID=3064653 RepID=UPI002712AB52|nr:tyrosine-protein phosphatase [Isoptericola sp. b408]MDO8151693.1 tyrosine-protein phosphatase [Isoptericola sp. b408]